MASEVLLKISREEEVQARLMSEWKYVVDTQSKVVDARREGIHEGAQQRAVEFARKLKSRGVAAEQIAEDTGLGLQQIEEL